MQNTKYNVKFVWDEGFIGSKMVWYMNRLLKKMFSLSQGYISFNRQSQYSIVALLKRGFCKGLACCALVGESTDRLPRSHLGERSVLLSGGGGASSPETRLLWNWDSSPRSETFSLSSPVVPWLLWRNKYFVLTHIESNESLGGLNSTHCF